MSNDGGDRVASMPDPPHPGEPVCESMEEAGGTLTETAARLDGERGTLSRLPNTRVGGRGEFAGVFAGGKDGRGGGQSPAPLGAVRSITVSMPAIRASRARR